MGPVLRLKNHGTIKHEQLRTAKLQGTIVVIIQNEDSE